MKIITLTFLMSFFLLTGCSETLKDYASGSGGGSDDDGSTSPSPSTPAPFSASPGFFISSGGVRATSASFGVRARLGKGHSQYQSTSASFGVRTGVARTASEE